MTWYLFQASYTDTGLAGLLKEGGSSRGAAVAKALEGIGGTLETFYYAFGYTYLFAIVDLPDNVDEAALSLLITAAGAGQGQDQGSHDHRRGRPGYQKDPRLSPSRRIGLRASLNTPVRSRRLLLPDHDQYGGRALVVFGQPRA